MEHLEATPLVKRGSGAVTAVLARLSSERALLAALLAFALLARLLIAFVVPPWQGPDEPKHFEYARSLVDKRAQLWAERRILNLDDTSPALEGEIITSMARHHFWPYLSRPTPDPLPATFFEIWGWKSLRLDRPSLYYFGAAAVLLPLEAATVEQQLLAVRLFSAVCSALTVLVAYLLAREVVPGDRFVPVVAAAFVAALPMHVFIGGMANSDNLVTLFGALVVLGLARGLRRGFTWRTWALALGALVLALAAKKVAVGLVPPVLLAGGFWLASLRGRRLWLAAVGASASVFVGAGVLVLNLAGAREKLAAYALNESSQLDMLRAVPLNAETWALVTRQMDLLYQSFWGVFGWFRVPLGGELYRAIYAVSLICAAGFLVWLVLRARDWLKDRPTPANGVGVTHESPLRQPGASLPRRPLDAAADRAGRRGLIPLSLVLLTAIFSAAVLAVAERLAYYDAREVPQGRYLFGVVVPIALVLALGGRTLLPRRFLGTVAATLIPLVALLSLDLLAYLQYLAPFYFIG